MERTEPSAAKLLDLIHHAVRASDFAALPALHDGLVQELDRPGFTSNAGELLIVRDKAQRNAACLLAAQRGIKSARLRLAEMRRAASGLVTYDRMGKRAEVSECRKLTQRL